VLENGHYEIIDSGHSVYIDVSLLSSKDAIVKGHCYQFIGEILRSEPITILAKIIRVVNGMDFDLYKQTVGLLREFLEELDQTNQ
jgi:hypothetical protein